MKAADPNISYVHLKSLDIYIEETRTVAYINLCSTFNHIVFRKKTHYKLEKHICYHHKKQKIKIIYIVNTNLHTLCGNIYLHVQCVNICTYLCEYSS